MTFFDGFLFTHCGSRNTRTMSGIKEKDRKCEEIIFARRILTEVRLIQVTFFKLDDQSFGKRSTL